MDRYESRRPDFERWAVETMGREGWPDFPEYVIERNGLGDYAVTKVQGAWIGWNAALDRAEQGEWTESGERTDFIGGSVKITLHLDEIDAPAWPFINEQAFIVGGKTGHIDSYQYERACGGVAALWDGHRLHALAVTVRDAMNRTRCIRVLAAPKVVKLDDDQGEP